MDRKEILRQAEKCVCGKRQEDYGSPEDNFAVIAKLWNVYLGYDRLVDSKDVAVMMALMKIARISSGGGTDDCFIDLAGYAACGGEILGAEIGAKKKFELTTRERLELARKEASK